MEVISRILNFKRDTARMYTSGLRIRYLRVADLVADEGNARIPHLSEDPQTTETLLLK